MPRFKNGAANPRRHRELLALSESSDFLEILLGEQNLELFTHIISIWAVVDESKLFGGKRNACVPQTASLPLMASASPAAVRFSKPSKLQFPRAAVTR